MNKKVSSGIAGVLALIAIIASLSLHSLPDFVSGLILGLAIVVEVIAIYSMAKEMKSGKNE